MEPRLDNGGLSQLDDAPCGDDIRLLILQVMPQHTSSPNRETLLEPRGTYGHSLI